MELIIKFYNEMTFEDFAKLVGYVVIAVSSFTVLIVMFGILFPLFVVLFVIVMGLYIWEQKKITKKNNQ